MQINSVIKERVTNGPKSFCNHHKNNEFRVNFFTPCVHVCILGAAGEKKNAAHHKKKNPLTHHGALYSTEAEQ